MEQNLVGTWSLRSFGAKTQNGQVSYPYGRTPTGRLIYDASGNMSVQIQGSGRQPFAADDKSQGDAAETQSAIASYEAYFGTYAVDEQEGVVIHRLEGALFPNWVGIEHRRFYRLSGAQLMLTTPPLPYAGGTVTVSIVWQRLA